MRVHEARGRAGIKGSSYDVPLRRVRTDTLARRGVKTRSYGLYG
ncbi:hypothetical protein HNQ79_003966 [Streptomyces candidus]|uniref:Uncharacterized protein n=1 Tax=Streptomyces candidus TaxID=67283 RepID=A0A7X0HH15_9ACTN|nr:hypothetical protein [Streptomyces candidus]